MFTSRYVKLVDGNYEPSHPDEADFLSVYRDNAEGLPEWVADFDPSEAELVAKFLQDNN